MLVPGDAVPVTATIENTGDVAVHGVDVSLWSSKSGGSLMYEPPVVVDEQLLEVDAGRDSRGDLYHGDARPCSRSG